MSKIAKYTACLLIIISSIASIIIAFLYFYTKNAESGTIKLSGLQHTVLVKRDEYGIPHIKAQSEEDGYFALGYVHAQDRLWQMEFQRHIVQGTLSELFGKATVEEDKILRTLGFYRAAKQSWEVLSPNTKRYVHSYTNGINAFLETSHLSLPFLLIHYKPSPWTDIDSIAFQKIMAWDLQSTWREKIENVVIASQFGKEQITTILPSYPDKAPTVLSNEDLLRLHDFRKNIDRINTRLGLQPLPGKGSNNWVVSGKLTESHKPLLASDPHLSFSAPILWYMADLQTPNLHVVGATIPGLPVFAIGHNDAISWGVTNACVDAQDLYIKSNLLSEIDEIIKVKNSETIHYPVMVSDHGPIISDVTTAKKLNKNIALKWPAIMPGDTTIQSLIEINHAQNWKEFTKALESYVSPSQNFIYADKKGNIGYYLSGKIPIREGWTGAFPVLAQDQFEWKGYIPFSQLPHVYNPKEGYILSANNAITTSAYPYPLTFRCGIPPYRAERIRDMLTQHSSLTKHDMEKIQNDTVTYLWKDLRNILLQTNPLDNESKKALKQLQGWDGDMRLDSQSATLFAYWYKALSQLTPKEINDMSTWPEPLFIKQQLETNGIFCRTNHFKNCHEFLSHSLKSAINDMNVHQHNRLWGEIHKAYFEALGLGSVKYLGWIWNRNIATGGDPYSVNVGTYDMNTMKQIAGAGYRQVIDMNNMNDSSYIIALGQSDNIFSRYYSNLMSLWSDGKYVPISSDKNGWDNTNVLKLEPVRDYYEK